MSRALLLLALLSLVSPVRHGSREGREVALTFDACPTSHGDGYDEEIVKILLDRRVDATVFVSGAWARRHPQETKKLAQHFEIGNHGDLHQDARMEHLTYAEARKDLADAQETLTRITGVRPTLYRPPGVRYNEDVLRAARDLSLKVVLYDVASGDPDPALEAEKIVKYVLWKARPGSIVVFHVNGRGLTTARTLPRIIDGLRSRGRRLVTVGELLDKP